ncbi:hypothetical protein P378_01525 [Desulforamulus profundi]|uniref:Uncharacterized protein n=2 Tax=Desulforamulus TaxID=2916693 RepID=A0A2C6L4C7_9FIRM|nr:MULTISPECIES: hypothetical protein [Desulforamulus]PHJ39751.1 hypothetical protein P378_01525 [Desulforamulus profundi]SHE51367.1 hypothetical protein SAMN02745133_00570 [Desulforamulus putei DSM 12395]
MQNKQQLAQCIQTCTKAANDLRSSANGINNAGVREMLTLGASHIEMCIRQCESLMRMP